MAVWMTRFVVLLALSFVSNTNHFVRFVNVAGGQEVIKGKAKGPGNALPPSPQAKTKAPGSSLATPLPAPDMTAPNARQQLVGLFNPQSSMAMQMPTTELRSAPEMLGDQPPPVTRPPSDLILNPDFPNQNLIQDTRILMLPGPRGFKVADNSSPRPIDRFYFAFNYFNNLNGDLNRRLGFPDARVDLYRETFGFEKTVFNGYASFGLNLPLNTIDIRGTGEFDGTSTAFGDLTLSFKAALYADPINDNWISAGLAVTVPTGPDVVGGVDLPTATPHTTVLQPYIGWLWNHNEWYVHGFSALDIPTDDRDITFLFTDIGVGYYLYHTSNRTRCLTAIIPTFEVHVTTPLNHRNLITFEDPIGGIDEVNLTYGVNLRFGRNSWLAIAVITPVTDPQPMDIEATAQFRIWF
ncbi:MAG: transporter [Gemmataceae bacterium]